MVLRFFIVFLFCFLSLQAFSTSEKCKEAVGIIEQDFDISSSAEIQSTELKINPMLFRPIEDLPFPVLAIQVFKRQKINYLGDLARKTEDELLKVFHSEKQIFQDFVDSIIRLGLPSTRTISEEITGHITIIKEELSRVNLQLGMDIDWPSDLKEVEALIKKQNRKFGTGVDRGEWA